MPLFPCLAWDLFSLGSLQKGWGNSASLMEVVGNQPPFNKIGTIPRAGQKTEGCCPWLSGCWGCHEAFLPGQDLPVILQPVQMPSPGTGCLPLCWAKGTICEGRKVIQPHSFWPDLHQCPIAFYRSAIGCGGAPAVQLWATWTRAQEEVA